MNREGVTFWRVACNTIAHNRHQVPRYDVGLAEEITFEGVQEDQLHRCTVPLLKEEEGESRSPGVPFHCILKEMSKA